MSTAIICIIIIVICVFGIRSYTKRLTHGCCGGGGEVEKRVRPKDKNPGHYPYISQIKIEGMTCSNCAARIENAFNSMDGMWAQADSGTGNVAVRMKEKCEEKELKRTVERLGYRVVEVETEN